MKIAITGLSNSGKTTVFNALPGMSVETTAYPATGDEPNVGEVKVSDPRLWHIFFL
jgi:ribosome-binding ATPase YchF (GTP1/OBG family)